jgi:hypothetical protein
MLVRTTPGARSAVHLYLIVKVADIANDRLVLHPLHLLEREDVHVPVQVT